MQTCELTSSEERELTECESVIERNLESFHEVGAALLKIRDGKLYRLSHKTFDEYCRDKWAIDRTYAHRIIQAAKIAEVLPTDNKPKTERLTRPLTRIKESAEQRAAWQEAVDTAPAGKITAKHVEEVVQRRKKVITDRSIVDEDDVREVTREDARIPGSVAFAEERKAMDEAMQFVSGALKQIKRIQQKYGLGEESVDRVRTAAKDLLEILGE